jgi:hypothetical protein
MDAFALETVECTDRSDEAASQFLNHLYALQAPASSPWKIPLLRALSTHKVLAGDKLQVTYYVYASRLLFELVADPAIQKVMEVLKPPAAVTPPIQVRAFETCSMSSVVLLIVAFYTAVAQQQSIACECMHRRLLRTNSSSCQRAQAFTLL